MAAPPDLDNAENCLPKVAKSAIVATAAVEAADKFNTTWAKLKGEC